MLELPLSWGLRRIRLIESGYWEDLLVLNAARGEVRRRG